MCEFFLIRTSVSLVSHTKRQHICTFAHYSSTFSYIHDHSRDPPENIFPEAHTTICETEDNQDNHLDKGNSENTLVLFDWKLP